MVSFGVGSGVDWLLISLELGKSRLSGDAALTSGLCARRSALSGEDAGRGEAALAKGSEVSRPDLSLSCGRGLG